MDVRCEIAQVPVTHGILSTLVLLEEFQDGLTLWWAIACLRSTEK